MITSFIKFNVSVDFLHLLEKTEQIDFFRMKLEQFDTLMYNLFWPNRVIVVVASLCSNDPSLDTHENQKPIRKTKLETRKPHT